MFTLELTERHLVCTCYAQELMLYLVQMSERVLRLKFRLLVINQGMKNYVLIKQKKTANKKKSVYSDIIGNHIYSVL